MLEIKPRWPTSKYPFCCIILINFNMRRRCMICVSWFHKISEDKCKINISLHVRISEPIVPRSFAIRLTQQLVSITCCLCIGHSAQFLHRADRLVVLNGMVWIEGHEITELFIHVNAPTGPLISLTLSWPRLKNVWAGISIQATSFQGVVQSAVASFNGVDFGSLYNCTANVKHADESLNDSAKCSRRKLFRPLTDRAYSLH